MTKLTDERKDPAVVLVTLVGAHDVVNGVRLVVAHGGDQAVDLFLLEIDVDIDLLKVSGTYLGCFEVRRCLGLRVPLLLFKGERSGDEPLLSIVDHLKHKRVIHRHFTPFSRELKLECD